MSEQFIDNFVERELRENGVYVSVTKGASMQPLFRTNRDVIVLRAPETEPKKYDVALYRSYAGKYILHRIIKVKKNEYIIRGDNTFVLEHVSKDRILAVLTEFTRKGKKHSVNDLSYKIYSRIWNFIYPVRLLYVKARRFAGKIYHRIFKRKQG